MKLYDKIAVGLAGLGLLATLETGLLTTVRMYKDKSEAYSMISNEECNTAARLFRVVDNANKLRNYKKGAFYMKELESHMIYGNECDRLQEEYMQKAWDLEKFSITQNARNLLYK